MASQSPFVIKEHVFEGQHIREYPAATALSHEDILRLHAKSYTPREVDSQNCPGDLTIIAAHANAFHKEVYEPFFEELYLQFKHQHGLTIGSIWIADQAAQGSSAVLNDECLGNDPHWFDHSRDILCMVNTFRRSMKKPIVGVGHSMGATQLVAASHFHPGLLDALVMLDPPMTTTYARSLSAMLKYSLNKPEVYASREQAEKATRASPFFKGWNPRALDRFIETAWRQGPTATQSDINAVIPKTSLHMEVRTLVRPNIEHIAVAQPVDDEQRYTYPDVTPTATLTGPVYNPHTRQAYAFLETLRPAALFLLAKGSRICPPDELEHRSNITGTGTGGSGGRDAGRVKTITIPGGHFLPMTNIQGCAEETTKWVAAEVAHWRTKQKAFKQQWEAKSLAEKQHLDPPVMEQLSKWDGKPWVKDVVPKRVESKL